MRTTLFIAFACITSLGCSDEPAPTPPMDVVIVYDIQAIDRPGDHAVVFPDLPPSDVSTDRGVVRCQMSSFVPCECAPGFTGVRRCQANGMYETTCRCDGFDAGPDDVTASDGANGDATSDAATSDADDAATAVDATATDVAMDAASGE